MKRVLITSTVGVEFMPTAAVVNATTKGFPIPSLHNHSGKTKYAAIKETNQLLMANVESIDWNLGRGQNG